MVDGCIVGLAVLLGNESGSHQTGPGIANYRLLEQAPSLAGNCDVSHAFVTIVTLLPAGVVWSLSCGYAVQPLKRLVTLAHSAGHAAAVTAAAAAQAQLMGHCIVISLHCQARGAVVVCMNATLRGSCVVCMSVHDHVPVCAGWSKN